jgi:hypothetical protein
MAADQVVGPYAPFDYGASVRWRRPAQPSIEGSICGFREIQDLLSAVEAGFPKGTILALVETESGESAEIPIHELELL